VDGKCEVEEGLRLQAELLVNGLIDLARLPDFETGSGRHCHTTVMKRPYRDG
jgi:hypothetical protein